MEYTEKIQQSFGKWAKWFRPFIESKDMDELFSYIKNRAVTNKILPASDKVFRCFAETDPDELKCIICGIGPYHTTYEKKGSDKREIIADGLALSCSNTYKEKGLQPSIQQIYESWEQDYGFDVDLIHDGDLSYLAKQGVLLYNIALTVEENKPLSMNPAWEKFNKFMWLEVINVWFRGIPVIFMGEQAHRSANLLTPMLHYPICVSHPASASYKGTTWQSEGVWKKVDKILWDNNKQIIQWYRKSTDDPSPPPWVTGKKQVHAIDSTNQNMPWEE